MDATDQVGTKESAIAAHFCCWLSVKEPEPYEKKIYFKWHSNAEACYVALNEAAGGPTETTNRPFFDPFLHSAPPAAGAVLSGETASTLGTSRWWHNRTTVVF